MAARKRSHKTLFRIVGSGGVRLALLGDNLTHSNLRSYAGMSGEKSPVAEARGGFQSAHRNTGKLSGYLEALVRNLCS